jgi:hypothetical protein
MSEVAGRTVPLYLSFDGGVTYKTLICLQQFDESIDIPIDEQETDCGKVTAPGTAGAVVNFQAICETLPSPTQCSLQDCKVAAVAGTKVWVKFYNPSDGGSVDLGEAFYSNYAAYLSNITTTKQTAQAIAFSGTINSTGELTVVAP